MIPATQPGDGDFHVQPDTTLTLPPSAYRAVTLGDHATLVLTGGTYQLENLILGQHAKVVFQAAGDVILKGNLNSQQGCGIRPQDGADLTANAVRFYIHGTSARLGLDNEVMANIYAPKGTVWIQGDSVVEGALIGKQVVIGLGVTVSLRSGF